MLRYVSYDLFMERAPLPKEKLAQILGPTIMVHAAADVVSPTVGPDGRESMRLLTPPSIPITFVCDTKTGLP